MKRLKFYLYNILLVALIIAILEASVNFLLNNPERAPRTLIKPLRDYYRQYDRLSIQVLPECAQYDKYLFYTLKPGSCKFENREFNTEVYVNSIGLRDDEISLVNPSIVTIGDSFTMGWGVQQDSTFSQLLETSSGLKVLNVGISSYGTIRELEILKRIDLSTTETIFIQYHPNDFEENQSYAQNDNTLVISDEKTYDSLSYEVSKKVRYYPGKQIALVLKSIMKQWVRDDKQEDSDLDYEIRYFLNTLQNTSLDLESKNIVVFELNSHNQNDSVFINALNEEVAQDKYPGFIQNLKTIDFSSILDESDYYILDDHINKAGHQKISKYLTEYIKK